jgi:hypothetical protein
MDSILLLDAEPASYLVRLVRKDCTLLWFVWFQTGPNGGWWTVEEATLIHSAEKMIVTADGMRVIRAK